MQLSIYSAYCYSTCAHVSRSICADGSSRGRVTEHRLALYFWHLGSPLAVIVYALIKDDDNKRPASERSPVIAIGSSIAITIAIVCGLTWAAVSEDRILPRVFLDSVQMDQRFTFIFGGLILAFDAIALALLWRRRRSALDLWLMVICCAWLIETTMAAVLISARFSLGWYAGRTFGLIATFIVLLVLLSETTTLYARLALSVMRRRGERQARQIAMDAMAASIAHEVSQPLAAVATNAEAGLHWLTRARPDLDEARTSFKLIMDDSHRIHEVIVGIRSMFQKDARGRLLLDANDLIQETLTMVDVDLRNRRVSVSTDLSDGLPQLLVDRGQLQQVFLNLFMNAIDAMGFVTDRARVLRITSNIIQEAAEVVVTVEDTGVGIAEEDKDFIFEPFYTTKAAGTGIGLTVCRSIIELHGGILRASANEPYGTIFQITLPIGVE
jgi:signal transduction histidine kinase